MLHDAVVVGAGPAGSSAAHALAAGGARVLLLEKAALPRPKPCGGGVSARTLRALPFPCEHLLRDTIEGGVFRYRGGEEIEVRYPRPVAHMVERSEFDHFLASRAVEAGAVLRQGVRVREFEELPDRVRVHTSDGAAFEGRYLVGADGVNGRVTRQVYPGLQVGRLLALEAEYPRPADVGLQGRVVIDFGDLREGYSWVFPKGALLNVGCAGVRETPARVRAYFDRYFSPFRPPRGRGYWLPLPFGKRYPRVRGRVLLAGDAAGMVNPFTGEGIFYAVRSGQMAASCVLGGDAAAYEAALEREFGGEFRWAARLTWLAFRFPALTWRIVRDHQRVMSAYFGMLTGEMTYEQTVRRLLLKLRPWRSGA